MALIFCFSSDTVSAISAYAHTSVRFCAENSDRQSFATGEAVVLTATRRLLARTIAFAIEAGGQLVRF